MSTIKHTLLPEEAQFLATAFPQYRKENGTNFPVSSLSYDGAGSTEEKAYWKIKAQNYGSGNLTLILDWYADSGTTGDIVLGARIAAITPDTDTQDVETKAFATQQTVTDTHLGTTAQRVHRATITISNLDSIAADDDAWLEISRLPGNGSDTMAADAQLLLAELTYSDT